MISLQDSRSKKKKDLLKKKKAECIIQMIDEISESRRVTHLFMQSELKSLKIYHRVSRCLGGIENKKNKS